jgi:hypothetical protein
MKPLWRRRHAMLCAVELEDAVVELEATWVEPTPIRQQRPARAVQDDLDQVVAAAVAGDVTAT